MRYHLYQSANLFRDADDVLEFSDGKSEKAVMEDLCDAWDSAPYVLRDGAILWPINDRSMFMELIPIPGNGELRSFAIGKYPVTNREFGQVHDSHFQFHPVTMVNFHQSENWAKSNGLRLPVDQEWEFAAFGGDDRIYPWGNEPPTNEYLIWSGSGTLRSKPENVGTCPKGASPFGVMDMAGNVWEWIGTRSTSAKRSAQDSLRVVRGGCWSDDDPSWVRAAIRGGVAPGGRDFELGFRCVLNLL